MPASHHGNESVSSAENRLVCQAASSLMNDVISVSASYACMTHLYCFEDVEEGVALHQRGFTPHQSLQCLHACTQTSTSKLYGAA